MTSSLLLPAGHHWGLNIERRLRPSQGDFAGPHCPKQVWHTTEGAGMAGAISALDSAEAWPHVIIDPRSGHVVQLLSFGSFASALRHPAGTPETNRAWAYQVEIVGFAKDSRHWSDSAYHHLAALAVLMEHRTHVPRRAAAGVSFANPRRLRAATFIHAEGHLGHVHVPGNDHTDPGRLNWGLLRRLMTASVRKYQD